MANHKSAEKRARQTERRTAVNTNRRSRLRCSVKKVEEAIASGDKKAAVAALRAAQPDIAILHVPAVFAQVNGNAVSAGQFDVDRGPDRIRLAGFEPFIAGLTECGDVVDVDAEFEHGVTAYKKTGAATSAANTSSIHSAGRSRPWASWKRGCSDTSFPVSSE